MDGGREEKREKNQLRAKLLLPLGWGQECHIWR